MGGDVGGVRVCVAVLRAVLLDVRVAVAVAAA